MQKSRYSKLLPLALIVLFALITVGLYLGKPSAKRDFKRPESRITVAVSPIKASEFRPIVISYGLVEPLIQSQVVAQVSGRIVELAENFRDGGYFLQGDRLLQIDPADYKIEEAIALASLADAKRALVEQNALAEQARLEWQRLGNQQKPSALALHEPQVAAAQAAVASAQASVERAQLNLERTEIRAPFDGRVLNKQVDLGQVVNANTVLGSIYATNAVEIRLPIKNQDLPLLKLPERDNELTQNQQEQNTVDIISELTEREVWRGQIVRTAGAVDENSRQLYVVARIDDPFGERAAGKFPLKIKQYVSAEIRGTKMTDAIIIPISSIYQGSYVYVYRDGAVYRQEIEIAWQDAENAIINQGLQPGDQLVLSPLGQVASGTAVKLRDEALSDAAGNNSKKTELDQSGPIP